MSQSTDSTLPMPVIEPDPSFDAEATVTIPVVPDPAPPAAVMPLAASPAAAPPLPPVAAYDPDRARALHAHHVLRRILATPSLPLPKVWEGHAYSSPMLDLTLLDGGVEALAAYQRVFGGQLTTEQVPGHESAAGFTVPDQEYAHLATVIEGIDVVVSCWSPATPAPEVPADADKMPPRQPDGWIPPTTTVPDQTLTSGAVPVQAPAEQPVEAVSAS